MLSQLIQRNYDKRRGMSVFSSKSNRGQFTKSKPGPPVGIYEHRFPGSVPQKKKALSKVSLPYNEEPSLPQFCSMADVKPVDFSKSTKRDEVSFYKDLARSTEARRYGLSLQEYTKLLRMHKSGKFTVAF